MYIVLERAGSVIAATPVDTRGVVLESRTISNVADYVTDVQAHDPTVRWVWHDTAAWYPQLLETKVHVSRCWDLRLCHTILRNSLFTRQSELALAPRGAWDSLPRAGVAESAAPRSERQSTLFDLGDTDIASVERAPLDVLDEFLRQREAVEQSSETGRLQRLLAAESAGALIAAEMHYAGLPWSAPAHDSILSELLGPRPAKEGARPAKLQTLTERIRVLLDAPTLGPESPAELLRALNVAGIQATSTRSWQLQQLRHPVIAPLLEFKKLQRLLTANGWSWLDSWIVDGRFRPDYVPGGVVTGRWATSGGGALQLPHVIRGAVRADSGWKLVVADASQLEPRILAAMAGDRAMAAAGAAGDLYDGIVASGAVSNREHAKLAMLGAMYGATSGQSGQLMPKLARAYPHAIGLVERAARVGERGDVVSTQLGRTSPPAPHTASYDDSQSAAQRAAVQERGRSWGRFTRNFVVQGTAAEWALCWMASIRRRLGSLTEGGWFRDGPHLVFFLHDEVVVHTPATVADAVVEQIVQAAAEAGRLVFGDIPVTFPLTTAVVDSYDQAK